jgi:hypothetical protein
MFPEYLSGLSIIASLFTVIWSIKYPTIIWESLTFRNKAGVKGHLISVATLLFFFGFVNLIIIIANKIMGV